MGMPIKKYRRAFSKLDVPQPPADLTRKTLQAIAARERKILIEKVAGLGILFGASVAFVVAELAAPSSQLIHSGFFQFASLFFSDFGAAIGNYPDLLLSAVESFPVFSAGLALAGLTVAIWSFAGFIDDINIIRA